MRNLQQVKELENEHRAQLRTRCCKRKDLRRHVVPRHASI